MIRCLPMRSILNLRMSSVGQRERFKEDFISIWTTMYNISLGTELRI